MTPEERALLQKLGRSILGNLASTIAIALVYGSSMLLFSITTHTTIKRGLASRSKRVLFAVSILSLLAASVYSLLQWFYIPAMIRGALLENSDVALIERPDLVNRRLHKLNGALMWLSLLPPIINDSVVIWRGWVLFPERRRVLIAAMLLCLVSFATALAVLPLSLNPDEYSAFLEQRPDLAWYLENAAPVLSLATNVIATSFIAYGLWLHRKFLVTLFNRRQQRQFRVQKSLSLLVESGIVYCGLQAIVLTLGFLDPADGSHMPMDIATQVFATVYMVASAMYPSLVAFLVQQQGSSFRESYASQDYGMHMDERP